MIKIYKIISSQTPSVYIGSTKSTLPTRLLQHKRDYVNHQKGKRTPVTSFDIVKYGDAKIELIKEIDAEFRYLEERKAQLEEANCCNKYNPMKYNSTRPTKKEEPDNFSDQELERINNAAETNSKYVLRNYYRYKDEKLKYFALRRTRKTGRAPTETTIMKYSISQDEIDEAKKFYTDNNN